jgi:formylglycine-generating enzyme required for sulfatase activity
MTHNGFVYFTGLNVKLRVCSATIILFIAADHFLSSVIFFSLHQGDQHMKNTYYLFLFFVYLLCTPGCKKDSNPTEPASSPSPELIAVQGGTFTMGNTSGNTDEQPVHSVTVSSFSIGKYEVTQKQWKEIVQWKQGNAAAPLNPDPSANKGDNLPVESVSMSDIQTWIGYMNEKEGTPAYRLPTEAEWEFAARGGTKSHGYTYSGSNAIDDVAWYHGNSGKKTHMVGTKGANELGIYDMSGNVWEWCSDWYDVYSADAQTNPIGPGGGYLQVLRGGWSDDVNGLCRVTNRGSTTPEYFYGNIGFRLLKEN